jgi:2,4-dienoyl-CoA reductase-like NADH-dependent reductase (Old Yellow Enzyme family)
MSRDDYPNLFKAFQSEKLQLRNRIVMSPMSRYCSPGGIPNDANVAYYRRRAEAGVGLIISEGTYIDHPAAPVYRDVPHCFGDTALKGWRAVLNAVHAHGAKMVPQLWHVGAARRLGAPPNPSVPGYGPRAIVDHGRQIVVEARRADIAEIVQSYARCARAAKEIGFDGIAIHGAHGYLIDQFLWSKTNTRLDEYGVGLPGRCRFGVEIVSAIRDAIGPDLPIIFRFSQWKATDYNARIAETPEELERIVTLLSGAGVDVFDVSTRRFYEPAFPGSARSLAAWTRHLSGKPVIAVGSIGLDQPHQSKVFRTADNVAANVTDLRGVEEALDRGDFDLAGVGRAILADPMWPAKVERGVFDEIAPFTRQAMDIYA